MILSFTGSNTIKNELAVKNRLRKLLSFYSAKEQLTIMCANANRFDELVCEAAFEVRLRSPFPINVVAIAFSLGNITTNPLSMLCDEVRYYTGRYDLALNKDMQWIEESNIMIAFLEKAEKSNAATFYLYALDNNIPTINIACDLER